MEDRSLRLLEYDKVMRWVGGFAVSEPGRLALEAWRPFASADEAGAEHRLMAEALRRVAEPGEWCWTGPGRLGPLLLDDRKEPLDAAALLRVRGWLDACALTRAAWTGAEERLPALARLAAEAPLPEALLGALRRGLETDGRIPDRASPALGRLRRDAGVAESRLQRQLERWARPFGENAYLTRSSGRWVVMVPAAGFPRRRGIVHDVSGSGQSLLVEPLEACEGNNRMIELQARVAEEERRILAELARQVLVHAAELGRLESTLARLDTLRARALWAREVRGSAVPAVHGGDAVVLREARHPLLIQSLPAEQVVPLDLTLGDGGRVLLVSGPNMGGKTVLLKTVGLAAALAASAVPVPAAEGSRVPRFTTLVVEVGDEQSVERGLSTFAAHLEALARMAERAAPDALLLCDELGAGTDPEEGAALGQALLEHFAARGAWAVVTSHLGPLKRVAGAVPGVVNGTLEFDERELASRFRFLPGVPGASYALAVAERRGFPAEILARARALTPEASRALERLLRDVEEARLGAERAAERSRAAEAEAARLQETLRQELARSGGEERRARRALAEQGGALLGRAQALLQDLHKALRAGEKSRDRAAELKRQAATLEVELASLAPQPGAETSPVEIVPGRRLLLLDLGVEAEVVSGPDAEGKVQLRRGAWRIQSHRSRLGPAGASPPSAPTPLWSAGEGAAALEADLRGMETDEALRELDRALDRAMLAGLKEVRVVHGVGRGVLRAAVARHLDGHPQVAAFRMGGVGEGGRGVTLVELG